MFPGPQATASNHLKMPQCLHDGHFLVRRACRHTGIFGFGQVVIGPHVQPALMLDLRDVQVGDVEPVSGQDVVAQRLIGSGGFGGSGGKKVQVNHNPHNIVRNTAGKELEILNDRRDVVPFEQPPEEAGCLTLDRKDFHRIADAGDEQEAW